VGTTIPTPETVGAVGVSGVSEEAARVDHVHAMPGLATASTSGFMSNTDKAMLLAATSATTPVTLMLRDANGRAQAQDPVASQDIATKSYVDNIVQGLNAKQSVRVATTGPIVLSGLQTIDTVTLVAGDRVLVKNQTNAAENGIYVVAAGAWSRALDANSWNELVAAFMWVEEGAANVDSGFVSTTQRNGLLDTSPISFTTFGVGGGIIAGPGLSKTGNTLSFAPDNVTLDLNANLARVKPLSLTDAHFAAANKDGANTIPCLRTLGPGVGQAAAGTHLHTGTYARLHTELLGDATELQFFVYHRFNTRAVVVQVFENSDPFEEVMVIVERTDPDFVTISFGEVPDKDQYQVIVMG
jgi:hypothetical protein